MQRARQLAFCALLAIVGGLVVTGCRADPGVAVYVGDVRYTQDEVDRMVRDAQAQDKAAVVVNRQWAVRLLVFRDLAKKLAAEKNVIVEPVEQVAFSQALGLPAGSEYARLWGEAFALENALETTVPPGPIADDDLLRFYRAGASAGLFPEGASLQVLRENLDGPRVSAVLGVRTLIADAVRSHRVTVNPRFAPLSMPLLRQDNAGRIIQLAVPFPPDTTSGVRDSG